MQTTKTPSLPAPMTLAAIRADRWAAVNLPIPDNVDPVLLNQASFAAFDCFNQREPPAGITPEAWEQWRVAAGERVKELADRMEPLFDALPRHDKKDLISCLDHGDTVRAWQQPAFSAETIAADPWTTVYLPVPKNADHKLLEYARGWAVDLAEYTVRDGAMMKPSITLPQDALQPLTAAATRIAELDARLQIKNSRWSGEPLGETAGLAQSDGQGQSH